MEVNEPVISIKMEFDEPFKSNSNPKKPYCDRHCFVPKCTSGYRGNPRKVSFFRPPKDADLLQKWRNMIPKRDKVLQRNNVVCERHFKAECIERFFRHIINGEEVLLQRGTPKLIEGALPTEYPDHPSHYTKKLPKKRNPKVRKPVPKKPTTNNVTLEKQNLFSDANLPSEYWTKIAVQNQKKVFAFALYNDINTDMPNHLILNPEKLVVVKELEDKTAQCSVYINGCTFVKDQVLYSVTDLQEFLIDVNAKTPCRGAGSLDEFPGIEDKANDFNVQHNNIRNKFCKGVVDRTTLAHRCMLCKCARKKLMSRRSYWMSRKPVNEFGECNSCKKALKSKRRCRKGCMPEWGVCFNV